MLTSVSEIYGMMVENVLLLTVDSLRAPQYLARETRDSLTCFDRILESGGVSMSKTFATGPETRSSFPAILTGTYGSWRDDYPRMGSDRPFLAASLSTQGIATGGFTSNPFLSRSFGYHTGFDTFHDYQNVVERKAAELFPDGIERPRGTLRRIDERVPLTKVLKCVYELLAGQSRPYEPAETIIDDTIAFVNDSPEPFFCWTHLMDVHHPCYPPHPYRETHGVSDIDRDRIADIYARFASEQDALTEEDVTLLRRLYQAAIAYVDDEINRLLDALADRDRLAETAIILTSDHGELYGEHGEYSKPSRLYDELLHVPLLMSEPPVKIRERRDRLFSLLDVPFLVHHLLATEPDSRYQGRALDDAAREMIVSEVIKRDDVMVSVRSDEYRYEIDNIRGTTQLYETGSGEPPVDSNSPDSEIVTRMRELARNHLGQMEAVTAEMDVSEDVRSRLAKLGYLDE